MAMPMADATEKPSSTRHRLMPACSRMVLRPMGTTMALKNARNTSRGAGTCTRPAENTEASCQAARRVAKEMSTHTSACRFA